MKTFFLTVDVNEIIFDSDEFKFVLESIHGEDFAKQTSSIQGNTGMRTNSKPWMNNLIITSDSDHTCLIAFSYEMVFYFFYL